jgi:enoyl-CoA hydratase
MYETLLLDVKDHVCTIRMNRPQALNACNKAMWGELVAAFREAGSREEVRCVILTGEGRAFCVGADLKETAWKGEHLGQSWRRVEGNQQQLARVMLGINVPIVAAINGYALGGGVEIALACDFRLAADSAVLGFPETTLGLFVSGGASLLLPRLVGLSHAKRLVYTGERLAASQAQAMGLVDAVAPAAALLAQAQALAARIAANAPVSVGLAKRVMNRVALGDLEAALAYETDALLVCYGTDDNKEGPRAFAEKRAPRFVGH